MTRGLLVSSVRDVTTKCSGDTSTSTRRVDFEEALPGLQRADEDQLVAIVEGFARCRVDLARSPELGGDDRAAGLRAHLAVRQGPADETMGVFSEISRTEKVTLVLITSEWVVTTMAALSMRRRR